MKNPYLIISIVLNVVLVAVVGLNWQYIAAHYNTEYTPSMSCEKISYAYMMNHYDAYKASDDLIKKWQNSTATPPQNEIETKMQVMRLQDIQNKITQLCNLDYTNKEAYKAALGNDARDK